METNGKGMNAVEEIMINNHIANIYKKISTGKVVLQEIEIMNTFFPKHAHGCHKRQG